MARVQTTFITAGDHLGNVRELINVLITPQSGSATKGFTYAYDDMGNRTSEQIDTMTPSQASTITKSSYNSVNQLTSRAGQFNASTLPVRFKGKINEPGSVVVDGVQAKMTQDPDSQSNGKIFTATTQLPLGNNNVPIVATDLGANGGNVTSTEYSLTVASGAAKTFTWDNNGNCTGYTHGSTNVTYQWDAEDRLVKITQLSTGNPQLDSEFTYDGFSRWTKIVEKNNGNVTSTKQFIWCGKQLCEERDANNNVFRRFFDDGEMINGVKYYFTRDHLGSVREMATSGGTVVSRWEYDPYGRRTKVSGSPFAFPPDFGFTGHYVHAPSGLHLALYRAYDADIGRWLNRDPIGEEGGMNLYGYVDNSPINWRDPFGLTIEIEGDADYKKSVQADLDRMKKDPDLKKMLDDLKNSANEHKIQTPKPGEGNSNTTKDPKNESNGKGSGSTTCYDPKNRKRTDGEERDPAVGLAHELQHAADKDKGTMDRSIDPKTGNKRSEDRAIETENKMRKITGDKPRTKY